MKRFIITRAAQSIVLLLGVTVVVFLLLHIVPGDPATVLLGENATPQAVAQLRAALGLNQPLYVQYWHFLSHAARGNLGQSIRAARPALPYVLARFPATFELAAAAFVLAVAVGVLAGVAAAVRRGGWLDVGVMFLALFAQSAPGFWLGLMMIEFLAVRWHLLPASGAGTPAQLVMPAVTLAFYMLGLIVRFTRSGMLEALGQDHVRTARAKGLREVVVIYRHALRNTLIPLVTVLGLQIGTLLGGAVVTETVFAWPGIGSLAVNAIYERDYPVVQVVVLLSALVFVVINWVVDLLYVWLDPRVQFS